MPLKLIPPRKDRSPFYRVRGTHLRVYVDRSTRTGDRRIANQLRKKWEREIESGELVGGTGPNFAAAALAYMKSGGERRYMGPLLKHFGETPLARIDQVAVNAAAAKLYPDAGPATRNRQVYTPIAAVLRHADPEHALRLRRPKQPKGRVRWIEPAEAKRLVASAGPKLRPLLVFLLGTGCRINEALALEWEKVNLQRRFAWIEKTKNGDPRGIHLHETVVAELAGIGGREGRVFGYRDRWQVYDDWAPMLAAAGIVDFTPHDCCHTWATWMRQYAGKDLRGLIGTGRWRDIHSVLRYQHVVASEESKAVDLLPLKAATRAKSVERRRK